MDKIEISKHHEHVALMAQIIPLTIQMIRRFKSFSKEKQLESAKRFDQSPYLSLNSIIPYKGRSEMPANMKQRSDGRKWDYSFSKRKR